MAEMKTRKKTTVLYILQNDGGKERQDSLYLLYVFPFHHCSVVG